MISITKQFKFALLICCSTFIFQQTQAHGKLYPHPIDAPQIESQALKDSVLSGDVKAYNRLKILYTKQLRASEREIIFYSLFMANKYHYAPAYFDVYTCLWQAFNGGKYAELWDMTHFDPKSKKMALYYLKQSAALGNKQAIYILNKQ
jgi:hypothetical protein